MSNETHHPSADRIGDYVAGELAPHEDASIHAHLAACTECSDVRDSEVRMREMLRAHARATERDLPLGFAARIVEVAVASESRDPWWRSLAAALKPAFAVPAVAAVALALYFTMGGNHRQVAGASVDAAAYVEHHAALAMDMPFSEGVPAPATFALESSAEVSGR